jgi:hypothetical protein
LTPHQSDALAVDPLPALLYKAPLPAASLPGALGAAVEAPPQAASKPSDNHTD